MKALLGYSAMAIIALSASGCGAKVLRTPNNLENAQLLSVQGYSPTKKSFDDGMLKIGSYTVNNLDRDWQKGSGISAGGLYSNDKKKTAYRFDLTAQSRTLHAECVEEQVSSGVAGFGSTRVTFGCACTEGGGQRAKIQVVDGAGSVQVGEGITYNVTALHDLEGGGTTSKTLGYQFQGPQGLGVLDVSGQGRAWVPAKAAEEEAFGLACSYAGLLLYRPAATTF